MFGFSPFLSNEVPQDADSRTIPPDDPLNFVRRASHGPAHVSCWKSMGICSTDTKDTPAYDSDINKNA